MSLNELLKNGLTKEIVKLMPKPKFTASDKCVACPLTNNYSSVGIAFSYIMMAELERLGADIDYHYPVDMVLDAVMYWLDEHEPANVQEYILRKKEYKYVDKVWGLFNAEKERFIRSGELTNEFIKSAIWLAQFYALYRTERYKESDKISDDDVMDIKNMYGIIPDNIRKFHDAHVYVTFGWISGLIMHKVDMVIDDMIIDISATKKMELTDYYWSRLIGYYILWDVDRNFNTRLYDELNKIGIYFSRYGKLWLHDGIRNDKNYKATAMVILKAGYNSIGMEPDRQVLDTMGLL